MDRGRQPRLLQMHCAAINRYCLLVGHTAANPLHVANMVQDAADRQVDKEADEHTYHIDSAMYYASSVNKALLLYNDCYMG